MLGENACVTQIDILNFYSVFTLALSKWKFFRLPVHRNLSQAISFSFFFLVLPSQSLILIFLSQDHEKEVWDFLLMCCSLWVWSLEQTLCCISVYINHICHSSSFLLKCLSLISLFSCNFLINYQKFWVLCAVSFLPLCSVTSSSISNHLAEVVHL